MREWKIERVCTTVKENQLRSSTATKGERDIPFVRAQQHENQVNNDQNEKKDEEEEEEPKGN